MHCIVFTAYIALTVFACTAPTVDIEAETAAVRRRSEALVAAETAKDVEGSLAFLAKDAVAQPAGAPQLEGHHELRGMFEAVFASLAEFGATTTRLEVSASGDMAYEYGVNRIVVAGEDGNLLDMGKYLAVWKKVDGEWLVAAVSFTSDASAPEPLNP